MDAHVLFQYLGQEELPQDWGVVCGHLVEEGFQGGEAGIGEALQDD